MHLTKMMKKMIFKPNYVKAENAAYELLQLSNVNELPVKVKKIPKYFPNLQIKSYSWFAKKQGMTMQEVIDFANSVEGCCYYKKSKNKYLILYNDSVENKGRMRFTIAHELGHFMLKHNEQNNNTLLSRNSLSVGEYDAYEKEANCFARTLLAPPTIIANLGKITVPDVSYLCEISMSAASTVISFLRTGNGYSFHSNVVHMFSGFIYKSKNKHYCLKCRYEFVSESPSFCPICSNTNVKKTFYDYGGDKNLKYDGYEVNELGRAFECPRCGNEETFYDGDHCKVCGLILINKCTNQHIWNGEVEWECGTILDGNARYCVKCGHESTFFQQDLLDDWQKEKKRVEEELLPF